MFVWRSRARGAGLALEPLHEPAIVQKRTGQELQRHAAAERFLLGLVDDPHAPLANPPHDPEVAQALDRAAGRHGRAAGERVARAAGIGAEVLHPDQEREQLADLIGKVGMAIDVLLECRRLATA
ncbi:MAG TPA: hypothetical protein VF590_17960 [Isosphaeraceae bacterium]|jgi:hypothetical protein